MTGGTKAALQLGAVILLPTIAGILILGVLVDRVAAAIGDAHASLEHGVRDEMAHWFGAA